MPLRPCSYGYSSLWKTVGSLLPGLLFIPNKFDRLRVAPMRPFWIPGARTPLQRPQHLPDDRQHQNNEHRVSGPPADAVHSRSSYSKATPSGSFCSNQVSAASGLANTFKCSLPFRQSGFLLWEAGYVIGCLPQGDQLAIRQYNWFVELARPGQLSNTFWRNR